MLRFGETKVAKEEIYGTENPVKIWDVNFDNIAVSKMIETKTNSNYLIGYLDEVIKPLVLILSKMSGYVKSFNAKDGDKDRNNKLMSLHIDDNKLFEKYKIIWSKIDDLRNIKLTALPVYDDRFIKTKTRTYGDKVYTNFCGLNVPEDEVECESFTISSVNSSLVYDNKFYLQVYLVHCAYKIADRQMTDYLDDNLFETDED